jgi:hypothetical protein
VIRKVNAGPRILPPCLPMDVLNDGIDFWDEPTKAEQTARPCPQTDKHDRDGRTTPASRLKANKR